MRRRGFAAFAVVFIAFLVWQFGPSGGSADTAGGGNDGGQGGTGPAGNGNGTGGGDEDPGQVIPGENPIEHVIFLIKENRTFDHYFGTYPGAEGATEGWHAASAPRSGASPARRSRSGRRPYIQPHDITHGFSSGLYAINGGEMNGFNIIGSGQDLTGYVQHSRKTLPAYWAYADRFVLADHFFTSMYGPTFPEHLYTVAAQSYGIVDNKSNADTTGNYCDDPQEYTMRFRDGLTKQDVKRIMKLEDEITKAIPEQLLQIGEYWEETRTCFDIKVLPDLLERNDISWKYYGNADQWMNGLQAIRHVRFGPMWEKVAAAGDDPAGPEERRATRGLVADPAGRELERAPRFRDERLHRRELDRAVCERRDAERALADDRDRHRLGRLRWLLRSRSASPLRRHGSGASYARPDHLAVHAQGRQSRRRLDRQHRVRVLVGAPVHRGAPRTETHDGPRRAGRSPLGSVRLHAWPPAREGDPQAARLPGRLRWTVAGCRPVVLAILMITPLLLGAGDPVADVGLCRASVPGSGDPPDLVAASGSIVEQGTSARWVLRFAAPLHVPDLEGRPFRVDILIRDPSVPSGDVAYYRDLNRIVRYDATPQQGVVILLLPEHGQNVFLGGRVDGDRLTIQVPGRQITRDLDLEGVPLEDLRWTAVVRDEHRCDVLGSARPHLALRPDPAEGAPTDPPAVAPVSPAAGSSRGLSPLGWVAVLIGLFLVVAAIVAVGQGFVRRALDRAR